MLAIICLCFQAVVVGFGVVIPMRKKYFNKDFMKQFAKEHAENFPDHKVPELGFPDIGTGRYAAKLDYKSWVSFNSAMRVHLNIVEQLPFIMTFLLVGGLIIPTVTFYAAWMAVAMRTLYAIGYIVFGPNARAAGAIFALLPIYAVGSYSAYSLF